MEPEESEATSLIPKLPFNTVGMSSPTLLEDTRMEIRDISNGGTISITGRDTYSTHHYYYGSSKIVDLEAVFRAIPSFRKIHQDMLAKATPGTGMWLLKSDKFRLWLEPNGDLRILWGSGLAGAGKTVLAALVVNVLQDLAKERQGEFCVVYVYFRYSDNKQITVRTVLEILIKQITQQRPDLTTLAQEVYADHFKEGTQLSEAQLVTLARQMTEHVFTACVFDALDEAPVGIQFALLKTLASLRCKLFITSRPLKTVEAQFPSACCFSIIAREEDIDRLIAEKLEGSANLLELLRMAGASVREGIVASVKQKCDGMFLHASLQLDAISQCLSLDDVKQALESFPSDIEESYRQTWTRMMDQNPKQVQLARMALLWVINAQRSMTIEELRHAVATCPTTYQFLPGSVVPEATLLSLCRGLIAIEEESKVVRLVHYTAKIPLETLLLESIPRPHALLAAVCMTHITASGFQNSKIASQEELEQILGSDPLLAYAHGAWYLHAKLSLDFDPCATMLASFVPACQGFPCLLDISPRLKAFDVLNPLHTAVRHGLPLSLSVRTTDSRWGIFKSIFMFFCRFFSHSIPLHPFHLGHDVPTICRATTPIMLACAQGFSTVVEDLISSVHINAVDVGGRSALSFAVLNGHEQCVKLLLARNEVQVNLVDKRGHSALMEAVMVANEECAKLLLDHPDINVNLVDNDQNSALILASFMGHEKCVKLFVDRADTQVNLVDNKQHSALLLAAYHGREGCVKLLLSRSDIQVNLVDHEQNTALLLAAFHGHETCVKLLLAHSDVQVNLVDNKRCSALLLAAYNGHEGCLKLLLARADTQVNLVDNKKNTPLMCAAFHGREGCIKLLLAHKDIQVNLVDGDQHSALILAAYKGHEGCVRLLLARPDIQVNLVDDDQHSALLLAAYNGHEGCVKLLLARPDIQVNLMDDKQHTALIRAAFHGREGCVRLLLAHRDVQVNLVDGDQNSALILAAYQGHEGCVRLLLARPDTQVNLVDNHQKSALMLAAGKGHAGCVKLLLERVDTQVNLVDGNRFTALMAASLVGQERCTEVLLTHSDININLVDHLGCSALMHASLMGREGCVKHLLARPEILVNLGSVPGDISALDFAASRGFVGVVNLLMASPGIRDNPARHQGMSASELAAQGGYLDLVERLKEHTSRL